VDIITFHVSLDSDESVHPNQTLKDREYFLMVWMMFSSARLFHRKVSTIMLTDEKTEFKGLPRTVKYVRSEVDPEKLMLARTIAQLKYVQHHEFSTPLVFVDSDILFNATLSPIFEMDFDVALTWRTNAEMPINGGLLILNNIRPHVSKLFFERFVKIYRDKYSDSAAWFGDQLALRDCAGVDFSQISGLEIVEADGVRVLLLPCDTYNFSPRNLYSEISTNLSNKTVLHFKGERKRLMPIFWNLWLAPRRAMRPWLKVLSVLERRWLSKQVELEQRTTFNKSENKII